jgi:hypothetical protein
MIEKIEEQEALIKGYARIKKRIERRVSIISNLVAEYSRYYHHSLVNKLLLFIFWRDQLLVHR